MPDLPGCVTTGQTVEETITNVKEAITGHIEAMRADGDPIPPPTDDVVAGDFETWVDIGTITV